MITDLADLKPYPAMKDSGVPWLGEVPEHWERCAYAEMGALLERTKVRQMPKFASATDVMSVLKDRGVIPYAEKGNTATKSEDITALQDRADHNDIVVNCMNVIIGSVGLSKFTGHASAPSITY